MNAAIDFNGGAGAAELAAGPGLRGSSEATLKQHKLKLDLIGCHGQTLYHQPRAESYAGRRFACTWQLGEAAVIAAAARRSRRLEFPSRRYARRRPGSAAGSAARLRALCRCQAWPRSAKHRRHRQPHGNSRRSRAGCCDGLRYRPRKHGDRLRWRSSFSKRPSTATARLPRRARCLNQCWLRRCAIPTSSCKPPRTAGREQFGREYAAAFLGRLPAPQQAA